jgi:hypothetical protein
MNYLESARIRLTYIEDTSGNTHILASSTIQVINLDAPNNRCGSVHD